MLPIARRSIAVLIVCCGATFKAEAAEPNEGKEIQGVRDARYCEIIAVVRNGFRLKGTVYNTLGLNDCPPEIWDGITVEAMKQRFGASAVILNGPRHFVMDSVKAAGATKLGETIEAGGLELTERAAIDLGLLDLLQRPYREMTINLYTVYTFKAGRPVFMLTGADGSRYAMQSYAKTVDKSLSYEDLPMLGNRLELPPGWRYSSMLPEQDLVLRAQGSATVVQDALENTYQKLD